MFLKPNRRGGLAAVAAGLLWLLVWFHQRLTHGPTEVNEQRLVLGLTWLDSAKFLVAPLILLMVGLVVLYQHPRPPARMARIGGIVTIVGLAFLILGVALEFWSFPWGSYAVGFDVARPQIGGLVQALASLIFTLGLLVFTVDLLRAKVIPLWIASILILGGLTTFYLTPVSWLPGVAWLLLGGMLWLQEEISSG